MPAYVIVNIEVTDPTEYAKYIAAAPATIAHFGGRYIARGGKAEKLEGGYDPKRVVVLEFESAERAKAWWSCPEYQEILKIRQRSANADMIVVDGL